MTPAADRRLGPAEPIPLNVLTGFLGAGKTSLLNRLIADPALAETAVIINEFGDVGLDHLLVREISEGVVLLQSGCLCCTLRGDLVDALEQLLRDLDNGRATFRRVILETTGLADPAPVLQTAMAHPYLAMRYRLDGVITVVDAINGDATLDAHLEAVKQAAVADRIVLTKTDLDRHARTTRGLRAPEGAAAGAEPGGADPRCGGRRGDAGKAPQRRALRSGPQDSRRRALARGRGLRGGARLTGITTTTTSIDTTRASARSRSSPTAPCRPRCSTCSSTWCARCTDRTCCGSRAS